MKKAALYDPYLDVLGGGEKHILSLLKVLDNSDFEIDIFWDEDLKTAMRNRFNLTFRNLSFKPNVFKKEVSLVTRTRKLLSYDYFFYVTDGSYFFSPARKNFIFCMVPFKPLYNMSPLNKLKTANVSFLSNSEFTAKYLRSWNITSKTIYPYIDEVFFENQNKKEKLVLSVGRFFGDLHVKNHKKIISVFKNLVKKKVLKDYQLVLVGGLKKEDEDYFKSLKKLISNSSNIVLKPNASISELLQFYRKAELFWHFTGFGVDETTHPEKTEHLGITPLEAMASSCLVFCYGAGGIHEIVKDGENGYIFNDENELAEKVQKILSDDKLKKTLQTRSMGFVRENFGYEVFEKKVQSVLFNR